jgi:hypothetical protein
MVRRAKMAGLDGIAITDHNALFPAKEARDLSREFGILVIPGIEGGRIALGRHWIALGIADIPTCTSIPDILASVDSQNGVSIAPHPCSPAGIPRFADLGFTAAEQINGTEYRTNRRVAVPEGIAALGSSDAHAAYMLGHTWTRMMCDATVDDVLGCLERGACTPEGSVVPFPLFLAWLGEEAGRQVLSIATAPVRVPTRPVRRLIAQRVHSWQDPVVSPFSPLE